MADIHSVLLGIDCFLLQIRMHASMDWPSMPWAGDLCNSRSDTMKGKEGRKE